MLRKVSLTLRSKSDLQEAARMNGAELTIADCRPLDRNGMAMLLELSGDEKHRGDAVEAIQGMAGVRSAYFGAGHGGKTNLLVVVDKPAVCRAAGNAALMCLDCPFNSTEAPLSWTFVAQPEDVKGVMSRLASEGVKARLEDISSIGSSRRLSSKEKGILAVAIEQGYFDFPRMITLAGLSEMVGEGPEALERILSGGP